MYSEREMYFFLELRVSLEEAICGIGCDWKSVLGADIVV